MFYFKIARITFEDQTIKSWLGEILQNSAWLCYKFTSKCAGLSILSNLMQLALSVQSLQQMGVKFWVQDLNQIQTLSLTRDNTLQKYLTPPAQENMPQLRIHIQSTSPMLEAEKKKNRSPRLQHCLVWAANILKTFPTASKSYSRSETDQWTRLN